jgi:hypothetical protein
MALLLIIPISLWTPAAVGAAPKSAKPMQIAKAPKVKLAKSGLLELTVTVKGGVQPLTYAWYQRTPGNTSTPIGTNKSAISVSPTAGTTYYWVKVTDANQNSVDSPEAMYTFTPQALKLAKTVTATVSKRTGLLVLSVVPTGGIAPYSFAWYQGAIGDTSTPIGTDAATISVSPTEGFTLYWVRITDSAGTQYDTDAISVDFAPATLAITKPLTGKIDKLSGLLGLAVEVAGGIAPYTYAWYQGVSGDTATPITTTTTSALTISPSTGTTNYWVRIADSDVSSVDSTTFAFTYTPSTLAIKKATAKLDKREGSVELEASIIGGIAPYTYAWFQGAVDDESTPVGTNDNEIEVNAPTGATTYWLKVTDAESTVVKSTALSVNFTPTALAIRSLTGEVDDRGYVELEVKVSGGGAPYTYAWFQGITGDESTPVGSNDDEIRLAIDPGNNNYWVKVTDRLGASVSSSTVEAIFAPEPLVIESSKIKINDDGIVELKVEVDGGVAPYTYAWFQGAVDDESTPVGTNSRKIELPIDPGALAYWVKVTDRDGTIVKSGALTGTYTPSPLVIAESESEIEDGNQLVINVEVEGGVAPYTYAWFQGAVDDESTPVGADDDTLVVDITAGSNTYWLKVTDRDGTVVKSDAFSTEYTPQALVIDQISSKPSKDGTLKIEAEVEGGISPYTYAWFQGAVDDESTPVGSNHDEIKITLGSGASSYWLKVTDQAGTVVKSSAITTTFTPSALEVKKITPSRTVPFQTGEDAEIELEVEARGGAPTYTYAWYTGTSGNTSSSAGSGKKLKLTVASAGTYTYWVRITDRLGATHDSQTITMTVIETGGGGGGGGGDDDEDDD